MNIETMLDGALFWAKKGFKVIPMHSHSGGKCTCGNPNCKSVAKHPRVKDWPTWATKDEEKIRQYWQSTPNANVGITGGEGFHILDVDTKDDGPENLANLEMLNGNLKTITVRSGSGGIHKYFFDKKLKIGNKTRFSQGLDWKSERGCVVAPPSIHKSGKPYQLLKEDGRHLSEVPDWLKDMLLNASNQTSLATASTKRNHKKLDKTDGNIPEGSRNNSLTGLAGSLRAQGMSQDEIRVRIHSENQNKCTPPLEVTEVERIISSVSSYQERPVKKDWGELKRNVKFEDTAFPDIEEVMIPDAIRSLVLQKAGATGLPKAVITVPILTTVSALLGSAYSIKPSENSDHSVFLNIWGLIVAESGSRKTTALSLADEIKSAIELRFEKIRADHTKKAIELKTNIEAEVSFLKNELKVKKFGDQERKDVELKIQKKIAQKDSAGVTPKYLFYTSDTTPESLAEICSANKRGVMIFRDELDGLFKLFIKKNFEVLRSMLNEGWNGGKSFRLTRVGRGISDVERMTISILGGVQPEVLIEAFREEMKTGSSGDGLLARFQMSILYRSSDMSDASNDGIDETTNDSFENLILRIHEETIDFNLDSSWGHVELVLDSDAEKTYANFMKESTHRIREEDFSSSAYRAHYSKLSRLLLSLSGQFHILDCLYRKNKISQKVGSSAIGLALEWVKYSDIQAQRIYSLMKSNHQGVKTLIKKIEKGEIRNFDTVRSIYRNQWSGLRDKEDVLAAVEYLSRYNWAHISFGSPLGGGRKTEFIQIHPDLLNDQTDNTDDGAV